MRQPAAPARHRLGGAPWQGQVQRWSLGRPAAVRTARGATCAQDSGPRPSPPQTPRAFARPAPPWPHPGLCRAALLSPTREQARCRRSLGAGTRLHAARTPAPPSQSLGRPHASLSHACPVCGHPMAGRNGLERLALDGVAGPEGPPTASREAADSCVSKDVSSSARWLRGVRMEKGPVRAQPRTCDCHQHGAATWASQVGGSGCRKDSGISNTDPKEAEHRPRCTGEGGGPGKDKTLMVDPANATRKPISRRQMPAQGQVGTA